LGTKASISAKAETETKRRGVIVADKKAESKKKEPEDNTYTMVMPDGTVIKGIPKKKIDVKKSWGWKVVKK
tara:strand:+ start:888 stop:1100 length:213 start_codon:yes stop_codon:yes gene_type:complete